MELAFDPRFSLIGFIIGFLIGMTGMGGGALMTPIMILIMGVKPVIAVGTDLAYSAVTKIIGGGAHLRQHTVHRRTAYLMALGSVPATVLGVGLIDRLRHSNPGFVNEFLPRAIALMLIVVALTLIVRPLVMRRAAKRETRSRTEWRDEIRTLGERRPIVLPILGAIVGFLVGLTSMGSGTLIIMALFFLYPRWHSKEFVGTDVFHAAILVSAAGIANFAVGNVNVPMMFALLIGSVPGVLLGSRLVLRLPDQMLRFSLATVLLISGAKLL